MSTDNEHENSQKRLTQDDLTSGNNYSQPDSWIEIEIWVKANRPELLLGLEQLLQLNLISQRQVKKLGRNHLSCALPQRETALSTPIIKQPVPEPSEEELVTANDSPGILASLLRSFLDELSIRWLLFIGIFLVLISSGVLAASQWQNFPLLVQYLVLLIYTFGFWGMGWWLGKHQGLILTARTLNQIATLLIPINFWAINAFGLGSNGLEWSIIIFAITSLSLSMALAPQVTRHAATAIIFLGLSYLHLIWHIPWLQVVGIYGGIMLIVMVNLRRWQQQPRYPTWGLLLNITTWSLLLGRILLAGWNQLPNYSLAVALLGWLLAISYANPLTSEVNDVNQQSELTTAHHLVGQLFGIISPILLAIAWLISVVSGITQSSLFWGQTIAISLLAMHLFYQCLVCSWRKRDLTAILVIGLQAFYLTKELIPQSWRLQVWDMSQILTKTEYFPESLLSITLFPYLIFMIGVVGWLYRRQQPHLAIYGEYLTLLFGIILTGLSLSNPLWRSLNLLLSTLTLIWVIKTRHPTGAGLVYLTHLLGLVTLINGISLIAPNLTQAGWSLFFLGLVVLEWTVEGHLAKQQHKTDLRIILQQSCWYLGLMLSTISYLYLLDYLATSSGAANSYRWSLIWLIVPSMLALIGKTSRSLQRKRLATTLSCIALMGAQLITVGRPETRVIALVVAVMVMMINVFNYRRTLVCLTHIGFGICLAVSLSIGLVAPDALHVKHWLLFSSVMILGLYRLRLYLIQIGNTTRFGYISQRNAHGILGVGVEATNFKLINKYLTALDYWAITLIVFAMSTMSIIYWQLANLTVTLQYLVTAGVLVSALFWRYRRQPNNYVASALVWLGELFLVGLLVPLGGNSLIFAIANILLGLVAGVIVDWLKQTASPWSRLNLAYAPLIYAGCAIIWRLSIFNSCTGAILLGAGFILLSTQLPNHRLQTLLNYGGIATISLGIYELVGYQLLVANITANTVARLTILALVTTAIALAYRLGAWAIASSESGVVRTFINLHCSQMILIAHCHWAIGSLFKIIAAGIAMESTTPRLNLVSIVTSFCLAGYAVIQGRDHQSDKHQDWWVYVGLVELVATLAYCRLIFNRLSLFDPWRVIVTCAVALLIYQIPWHHLGWRTTPWRRTALIVPAVMAMVAMEDMSFLSLIVTALFYLRIAYAQHQIRWSYVSLGFVNWFVFRLVWQYQSNFIWGAGIIGLSILYIAQIDPYYRSHRQHRHYLRLGGSSIICVAALVYQPLIIPGLISFSLILVGLGLRIRAFLFTGTVTLVMTAIHQLVILVLTYSFLKWVVGLLAGIGSIAIAAGFERHRERVFNQFHSYRSSLRHWQ